MAAIRVTWQDGNHPDAAADFADLEAALAAEDARQRALTAGPAVPIPPIEVGVHWRWAHEGAAIQEELTELRAIGLDAGGAPSRILIRHRADRGRTRIVFVGAIRTERDRLLLRLFSPLTHEVLDVPGFLQGLLAAAEHR